MQKEEPILTHTEKLRFLHRQNPPLTVRSFASAYLQTQR